MPSHSEKQRKFMGAELSREREGKKTQTGMNEEQLSHFASKPIVKETQEDKDAGWKETISLLQDSPFKHQTIGEFNANKTVVKSLSSRINSLTDKVKTTHNNYQMDQIKHDEKARTNIIALRNRFSKETEIDKSTERQLWAAQNDNFHQSVGQPENNKWIPHKPITPMKKQKGDKSMSKIEKKKGSFRSPDEGRSQQERHSEGKDRSIEQPSSMRDILGGPSPERRKIMEEYLKRHPQGQQFDAHGHQHPTGEKWNKLDWGRPQYKSLVKSINDFVEKQEQK
jgi:hypothetical protein